MVGSHLRFPLLTILLLTGVAASGQRLDGPVQGLAQKIAAALKPHAPVALSLRNVSSMSAVDTAATQVAMERELRALGLTVGDRGPDGNEVQVTLSENSRGFVWVAEIRTGDTRAIAIEETPKPQPASGATSMAIEKKLVP